MCNPVVFDVQLGRRVVSGWCGSGGGRDRLAPGRHFTGSPPHQRHLTQHPRIFASGTAFFSTSIECFGFIGNDDELEIMIKIQMVQYNASKKNLFKAVT